MGEFAVMNEKKVSEIEYKASLDELHVKKSKYLSLKRAVDIVAALLLAVVTLPIIVIASVAVKLETPGKAFYRQERLGLLGKPIYITKIRSMYDGAEKKSGAMWAQKNDTRITKVGKFIRQTRIDELPQIWNVLKGDMSFIGPRPERPEFTKQFMIEYPGFHERLSITPGLSGWAQVTGGYEMTPGEKMQADIFYINNVSLMLDVKIVVKTLKVVITGDGAR